MTDEHKDIDSCKISEEKIWENLTKEYLTTDQKLDIIREHNIERSEEEWAKAIDSLRDYVNRNDK